MSIAFPGESAAYRAARDRLLEREVELRRAMEAVAAARRELPPGGVVPEDYVFQGRGEGGTPTDMRLSELFAPGKDSLVIYSFMFPRDPSDGRDQPRERRRCCRLSRAHVRHARPCSISSTVPQSTPPSTSTLRSSRRLRWRASSPSPRSAAGGGCGFCPQPPIRITATTLLRTRSGCSGRCSTCSTATARRSAISGARSSSTRRPSPVKRRATSAPSNRSRTCSTSLPRDARRTGTSSCSTTEPRQAATQSADQDEQGR